MAEPAAKAKKPAGARLDLASVGGIVLALGGIVGGLLLEGGKIKDISQFTAALIVLGGTFGAVMVSTPMIALKGAILRLFSACLAKARGPRAPQWARSSTYPHAPQ